MPAVFLASPGNAACGVMLNGSLKSRKLSFLILFLPLMLHQGQSDKDIDVSTTPNILVDDLISFLACFQRSSSQNGTELTVQKDCWSVP